MVGSSGDGTVRARTMRAEVRMVFMTVVAVAIALLVVNVVSRGYVLLRLQPTVHRLEAAQVQLNRLHTAMVDEETGERGYLAGGSAVFLQPYRAALPVAADASARLARLVRGGGMTTELLSMDQARQKWTDEWADAALATSPGAPSERASPAGSSELTPFLLQGKSLFDAYRQAHDRLYSDIQAAIAAATADESDWLLVSGIVQAAIALGVVGAALVSRRRILDRLTRPVGSIAETVNRIAGGDLSATHDPMAHGLQELQELQSDVERMATALRAQTELAAERELTARRHADHLSVVLDAARDVAGSLNLRYVMSHVAHAAQRLGAARVRIWLTEDEEHSLRLAFDTAAGPSGPDPATATSGVGLVGRAAKYGRPVGPEPTESRDEVDLGVPLVVGGQVVGVLECLGPSETFASETRIEILEALAVQAAGAVASAQLHERTAELAVTDALTGLPNRRAFETRLEAELLRAERYRHDLTLISVDLDHFKSLNDRFGHAYGDLALQQAAGAIQAALRDTDAVFRVGGEELVVLCPETTAADGARLAERLRASVEASSGSNGPRITASFGVAGFPAHARDKAALLAAADQALYASKELGRNRVTRYRPPVSAPAERREGPVSAEALN